MVNDHFTLVSIINSGFLVLVPENSFLTFNLLYTSPKTARVYFGVLQSFAVSLLQSEAYDWWKLVLRSPRIPNPIPWEFFAQEFMAKYVYDMYRETKWKQFVNLKQKNLSKAEYEKEFSHLSKYAP